MAWMSSYDKRRSHRCLGSATSTRTIVTANWRGTPCLRVCFRLAVVMITLWRSEAPIRHCTRPIAQLRFRIFAPLTGKQAILAFRCPARP